MAAIIPGIKGWHSGEVAIQKKMNYAEAAAGFYARVRAAMPDQHREFHSTRLPFVPVTTLDAEGRPWGSIFAGADGNPGFTRSPDEGTLTMKLKVWEGDPLLNNAELFKNGEKMLAAGIGIEFTTRRRNKWAGWIERMERKGDKFELMLHVNETCGNCPKYINIRDVIAHPETSPKVIYQNLHLSPDDKLPDDVIEFIHKNDTVFIGTTYVAPKEQAGDYPSHLGMNQRGGREGFVRVNPTDKRTVVVPDFSGNRHLSSLGNIEVTPLAALTFISFDDGGVLYLTGTAKTYVGSESQAIMPLQNALTAVHVTGFTFVRDALPVRAREGSTLERSPYSPPVRLLANESTTAFFNSGDDVTATLTSIEIHSASLATFTWSTSQNVKIRPGQAAILDFSAFVGEKQYQHMAADKPSAVNDDRIRTWTVSSAHSPAGTNSFKLTMREKPGGMVTGALFNIARRAAEKNPSDLADARALNVRARLVGIQGDFVLPKTPGVDSVGPRKLLWVAGGIGVTPFMSMLVEMTGSPGPAGNWDIRLVLATREPDVLMGLIADCLGGRARTGINLTVDLFSSEPVMDWTSTGVSVNKHSGRVKKSYFVDAVPDAAEREVYLCGSLPFEKVVLDALDDVGVPSGKVTREGFEY